MTKMFEQAAAKIAAVIKNSWVESDSGHSLNTREWLLRFKPDADEILQLAALAHDLDRALPDRIDKSQFNNYENYKTAHARHSGEAAAKIVIECGYPQDQAERLVRIITAAEVKSDNPESNLIMDADSISYFEYNLNFYLKLRGEARTLEKMKFMYERASDRARKEIDKIMEDHKLKELFKKIS